MKRLGGNHIGLAKSRKGVLEARLSPVMGEGVFFQKLLLLFEYISFKISIFNLYQHSAIRFARTFLNLTAHLSEPKKLKMVAFFSIMIVVSIPCYVKRLLRLLLTNATLFFFSSKRLQP